MNNNKTNLDKRIINKSNSKKLLLKNYKPKFFYIKIILFFIFFLITFLLFFLIKFDNIFLFFNISKLEENNNDLILLGAQSLQQNNYLDAKFYCELVS